MPDPRQGKRSGKSVLSFMRRLRERFFLRFHMTLILTATGLSGLLVSKLLILLQVENIIVRYPITVLCSYLAFFLFVKLWLVYMSASQAFNGPNVAGDVLSDLPNISGGGSGPDVSLPKFGGGGGGTGGGGGATGDFDGPATNVQALFVPPRVADPASGAGNSVGDAVSGVFDLDDAGVILIAIGVLLTAIFGAAIYLVYIAPHILSEAAFNFLLGTSLIRSYRKINHPDWMGSVFQDTYKPFVGVLLISFAAAWVIHAYAPNITKISDLFTR
ncbi:MAG TPA: hypothetical protein VL197_15195 [Nitrospirota bacterium]|nr:hypothetical protein [Nitrospirota bacterium]